MKKNELIDAIKAAGADVNSRMTKDELEKVYASLIVHEKPRKEETPEEPEQPEAPEEPEQPEAPEAPEQPEAPEAPEAPEQPKEPEAPEQPEVKSAFDELSEKIGGAKAPEPKAKKEKPLVEKTRRKSKKGESSPDSFRINGYVLLLATDVVFPFAFAGINNLLDKKTKVKTEDLQLSEKDFSKLEPLADQAADYLMINLNPVAGYFIMCGFMYGNNLMLVRSNKNEQ